MKDPYTILMHPLSTEKAIRKMEAENVLIFIVDKKVKKSEIKWAVEKAFNAKVIGVNTLIDIKLVECWMTLVPMGVKNCLGL